MFHLPPKLPHTHLPRGTPWQRKSSARVAVVKGWSRPKTFSRMSSDLRKSSAAVRKRTCHLLHGTYMYVQREAPLPWKNVHAICFCYMERRKVHAICYMEGTCAACSIWWEILDDSALVSENTRFLIDATQKKQSVEMTFQNIWRICCWFAER